MGQPTWQQIEAEAHRRGKLDFDNGVRSWTIAEKIVEVMREGWTPPDPRLEAYFAWCGWRRTARSCATGRVAFIAGADWGEKHALELLTTQGETAVAASAPDDEGALDKLGAVATLRAALQAMPPRPHIRPIPREARPNVIGWAGRHKTVEVFFIPQGAWRRMFKEPRNAAHEVRKAGFMIDQLHTPEKRLTHNIQGGTYYLIRPSILNVEETGE